MPPSRPKTASSPSGSAPLAAMEARSVDAIPRGPEWQYEPKWDGFRCLLARQGRKVDLRSKSGEDLARYFPELVEAALKLKTTAFRLDREILVPPRKTIFFRRSVAANSPRCEPRQEIVARDAGAISRIRYSGDGG